MTVLVAALSLLLTMTLGTRIADVSDTTTARTRAQGAADAAALAAVAEGMHYGRGGYEHVASIYARSNGAELIDCICVAGSYRVEVTVQLDGVRATAAAELDPSALRPDWTASVEGLHPRLREAVDVLVVASDGAVRLVSGYRSAERQALLWSRALARYGDPEVADDWVARPGASMHERGLAVDLGGDLDRAVQLIDELDLPMYRPLQHEPWHFELLGSR